VLRAIFDLTSGSPRGLTRLAAAEVRHLLGAAILVEDKACRLSDPSPVIEDQPSLAALERANSLQLHRYTRDRFIAWAAVGGRAKRRRGPRFILKFSLGFLPTRTTGSRSIWCGISTS
jgi:hypothetical protein